MFYLFLLIFSTIFFDSLSEKPNLFFNLDLFNFAFLQHLMFLQPNLLSKIIFRATRSDFKRYFTSRVVFIKRFYLFLPSESNFEVFRFSQRDKKQRKESVKKYFGTLLPFCRVFIETAIDLSMESPILLDIINLP